MEEGVFDQVPDFVEVFVILTLILAVLSRWNDSGHALLFCLVKNVLAIVTPICEQVFCTQPLDKPASLRALSSGTVCNMRSDRQTKRIHGQMYLGVKPPFVALISWLPPLAPAAWGWTLQWLASMMSHS